MRSLHFLLMRTCKSIYQATFSHSSCDAHSSWSIIVTVQDAFKILSSLTVVIRLRSFSINALFVVFLIASSSRTRREEMQKVWSTRDKRILCGYFGAKTTNVEWMARWKKSGIDVLRLDVMSAIPSLFCHGVLVIARLRCDRGNRDRINRIASCDCVAVAFKQANTISFLEWATGW